MKLLLIFVLSILMSLGVLSLVLTTFNKAAFSGPTQDSSVLEQAQRSLQANQNQSSSVNQQQQDAPASKITRGAGSFSTYENADYQISIKFPNNWKPSEVNLAPVVIVRFDAPEAIDKATSLDEYVYDPAWVIVASQKLPEENMTLDDYVKFLLKDVYQNVTEYKIISSSKSNLAGIESERMIMYEYADQSLKVMRNVAIDHKTNAAYIVKYVAHPGMFYKYLPLAQEMENSFRLK